MLDIHDNQIMGYEVELCESKIVVHTCTRYLSGNYRDGYNDKKDIIFTDVFASDFENGLKDSIIFGIDIYKIEFFLTHNKELLNRQKAYHWPCKYENLDQLLGILIDKNLVYYVISSSNGLSGWILAKSYEIIEIVDTK